MPRQVPRRALPPLALPGGGGDNEAMTGRVQLAIADWRFPIANWRLAEQAENAYGVP